MSMLIWPAVSCPEAQGREEPTGDTAIQVTAQFADSSTPSKGGVVLERDDFSSNRHRALSFCLSMIFSENRYHFSGSCFSLRWFRSFLAFDDVPRTRAPAPRL